MLVWLVPTYHLVGKAFWGDLVISRKMEIRAKKASCNGGEG